MIGTGRLRLWPEPRRLPQTGPIERQSFRIVLTGQFEKLRFRSLYPHPRGASGRMRMWEGGGRLVNRLGPSDQHVPGSVELMTLRARRPYARARLVPATSATQPAADGYRHDGGSRDSQSCRTEMTSYPPGRRFPGPGSAAMGPRSTPDRRSADRTPDRRGLERGREDRPRGGAGRPPSPRFPASVSQRCTPLRPTGRPGERDCGLGRVG